MYRIVPTKQFTRSLKKIIEKNGGVLENQVPNPEMGFDALRFWIDIK